MRVELVNIVLRPTGDFVAPAAPLSSPAGEHTAGQTRQHDAKA